MPTPTTRPVVPSEIALGEAIAMVDREFATEDLLTAQFGEREIARYYRISNWGYRRWYSPDGALHIGIDRESPGDPEPLEFHASYFAAQLAELSAQRAVEFGCGMGFNLHWLAAHTTQVQLLGIDLTPRHVQIARRKVRDFPRATVEQASYERLPHQSATHDAVLAVETLCQTPDPAAAVAEAYRLLRPGGRLVVIDCFRSSELSELDPSLARATQLVEKSTAVSQFKSVAEWESLVRSAGFTTIREQDLSSRTASSLLRLQRLALRYFGNSLKARVLRRVLPKMLARNAIGGLLMPLSVGLGAHVYRAVVHEKPVG